jgi:4-diphosphocytidyl-2-C-methyl-D-erythritol kinase
MYLRRGQLKRIARAPAKLNLYLEILGRRRDGFHELEMLMVPVRLADSLALTPTPQPSDGRNGEIRLNIRTCFPLRPPRVEQAIPAGQANLVVRALEMLGARSGCRLGAQVELVKRIPAEAGLGGASSDAAAALQLANRAWKLHWSRGRLAELAAEIGSDVPFFLYGGSAICRGRGEQIEPLGAIAPLSFVIVKPAAGLSTAEVYEAHDRVATPAVDIRPGLVKELSGRLTGGRHQEAGGWMHNRLQAAAASLSPWVQRLQAAFAQLDCLGHQLTGSGTAYFGICRHAQHARRVATLLRTRQLGLVFATHSYP